MNAYASLVDVSEQQLLRRFADLVEHDRANTALLLAHIAEIDARKLWAKQARSSMFVFCMERFHMSESVTAKRIWAARTARRFPVILAMVASGELHLSGISQLGKHLTEDNHVELLARAKHKSSREIDVLVAAISPRPDVPSRVRALPISRSATVLSRQGSMSPVDAHGRGESSGPVVSSNDADAHGHSSGAPDRSRNASGVRVRPCEPGHDEVRLPAAHKQIVPLARGRFKIEITVDQNTHDLLRALQDLLKHQFPTADPALVVSRAIELLLAETLKKKAAVTQKPRSKRAAATRSLTSRCAAEPTISTKQIWSSAGISCHANVALENRFFEMWASCGLSFLTRLYQLCG
jgi:hypothetical protein